MMRLNHVESFYVFLLHFRSEGNHCKGQPGMATTSPLVGVVDHLQGGGRLRQGPLQRGDRLRPGPARKGAVSDRGQTAGAAARAWPAAARRPQVAESPVATPQGLLPTVCRRSPVASLQGAADCGFSARRKAAYGQRHRPQVLPPVRAAASSDTACGGVGRRGGRPLAEWLPAGKGNFRLRRGSNGGDGAVRLKEG
ncbi:hypothetical protein BHM03_00020350 [Ensete ventricosum]|nr:hypothetical protein BHM03_00020350 [Ensete ventricosum]